MRLPDSLRSRAVLIGTSEYSDERLPRLSEVSATISALHSALTDPVYGIFQPEHCVLVGDEGDLRQVGSVLRSAARTAEDLLLVYYSGHGLIGGVRQDLYLALSNSDLEDPEFNSLEYDKLRSAVLASRASTKIIILDCCFAARALEKSMSGGPDVALTGQMEVRGTYVLAAAPRDKVALIRDGEQYTAFSGRLLRLLTEGLAGSGELLTVDEIYRSLSQTMLAEGLPIPESLGTLNADELALTRNRAFVGTIGPLLQAEGEAAWIRALGGEWRDAEPVLRDVAARQKRYLGALHGSSLLTLQRLGLCTCAMGEPDAGLAILEDLLPVQSSAFGPDHPDTLTTRQYVAVALMECGAHEEAVAAFRLLLPDRRRVLGADDEQVLRTTHMLARALACLGERDEASTLLREVASARERLLGEQHPHTTRALNDLRSLVKEQRGA